MFYLGNAVILFVIDYPVAARRMAGQRGLLVAWSISLLGVFAAFCVLAAHVLKTYN